MTPPVIGHRGACGHAPENTLASFRKAAQLGVGWVEFDAALSSDKQIVIFHDDDLERTTGTSGRLSQTPWAKLQGLDAGSWFSSDFTDEPIPTLRQTFELLAELGLGAVIEIKPASDTGAETGRLVAEMTAREWPETLPTPILSSFDEQALTQARITAPDIPRALNVVEAPPDWLQKLQQLDCIALHSGHAGLTEKTVRDIIGAGYGMRCFTVNDTARAETLFSWGVDGVFTDFPERIVNYHAPRLD